MEAANETVGAKMTDVANSNLHNSQGVDCSYGVYGVLVSAVLFQFINWLVKAIGPPKSLRDEEWKWRNLVISWLHALVCVAWCAHSFIVYPELLQDLQYFLPYSILFLVSFSTGYFLYDFWDIVFNKKTLSLWEVELHHISVGGMFFYNLVNGEWLAFNVIALLVEVNSFFLHSRKLLQMINVPFDCRFYRTVIFLNITTFVIFRGAPLAALSWAMTQWYDRVTLTYYCCLGASMFVMIVMNPILFMRLLRSDYLRNKSHSSKNVTVLNGNNNHVTGSSHTKQS